MYGSGPLGPIPLLQTSVVLGGNAADVWQFYNLVSYETLSLTSVLAGSY